MSSNRRASFACVPGLKTYKDTVRLVRLQTSPATNCTRVCATEFKVQHFSQTFRCTRLRNTVPRFRDRPRQSTTKGVRGENKRKFSALEEHRAWSQVRLRQTFWPDTTPVPHPPTVQRHLPRPITRPRTVSARWWSMAATSMLHCRNRPAQTEHSISRQTLPTTAFPTTNRARCTTEIISPTLTIPARRVQVQAK